MLVAGHTSTVRLRDGTEVTLRPIVPEDKDALVEGFRRLSDESRRRRFLAPIHELTPKMLVELTEIDYVDHFAWVAFATAEGGCPGVGVARYVRVADEREVAEAAVTVVDAFQRRGLGTVLLRALAAAAIERGIRRFRGFALEENRPIRELMESLGAETFHESPGLVRVEVELGEGLERSPLRDILRAVARGEGPAFKPPPLGADDRP